MKLSVAKNIVAGAMVWSMALPAWAADEAKKNVSQEYKTSSKTAQTAALEKQPQVNRLNGEIASIDHTAKTITVKSKRNGKEITVAAVVDDHTGIRDGKITKSLADLKVGERVRIYYEHQEKQDLARNILLQPSSK
jgi:Cu/Ag efflux protein CusF